MLAAACLLSACSPQEQLPAGTDSPTTAGSDGAFACSTGGGTRFPSPLLEGPELSPEEFVETQVGGNLHDFFTEGEGAVENDHFDRADGFSIVSEDLVLGYFKGLPDSTFHLADGEIRGWGGCNPTRVNGDLVAARWEPQPVVDIQSQTIPIHVEGGACVTENGQDVITDLVEIELDEREDRVEVIAWTRDKAFEGACAGVGIVIGASVELEEPLGERPLFNGGPIPPEQLEFATSDGPHPSTTIDDSGEWSLGRLDCSPGVLIDNRVPDSGQEPIEVAQDAAPATVEIESDEPLWWWGLNQNGAVIVAVALGDSPGADYQVWACNPPLGEEATPSSSVGLPEGCEEFDELYPGANDLPEDGEVVAQFDFGEGVVVLVRFDRPDATSFGAIECFPGGGEGFSGGGPGETWQGCYWVAYSDEGYAIAIVEDPTWSLKVGGVSVEVAEAGGVGAGFVEGVFDRTPAVEVTGAGSGSC